MTKLDEGNSNVYAVLSFADAERMQSKAQLVTQIRQMIIANQWTQTDASKITQLSQPEISNLLDGKFLDISEATMLDCLERMGQEVQTTNEHSTH